MARKYLVQVGSPIVERAANDLRTVTRIFDVDAGGLTLERVNDEVLLPYGTADEEFGQAILVRRTMEQATSERSGYKTRLVEVYQELLDGLKKTTEEDRITRLNDDRTQMERKYVCYSKDADTVAASIGAVVDGRACANVVITKRGPGAEIVETYISAGKLVERNSTRYNGALSLKTLTYFNEVPPTPPGHVLVDTQIQDTEGVPTYTYDFAAGSGEIDRDTDYSQCGSTVDGSIGVTRLNITHLTSDVGAEPGWSGVGGYVKISVKESKESGHKVWRAVFAKGAGLVSQRISPYGVGLRRVTNVSLGTKVAPSGILVDDDYRLDSGFTVYTTSAIQTAAGGADPTSGSTSYEDYVNFTYPGRAKAFTVTYSSRKHMNVFESPPVTAKVKATIAVSYQSTSTLPTPSPAFWNPTEWAVLRAQWIGFGDNPHNRVNAMPGYRSVSNTPLTETCSAVAPIDVSIFGSPVFGNTTARIIVEGGPADPGGNSYTLDMTLDPNPAFVGVDGTKYYRLTTVTATIPAQAALPV